MLQACSTTGKAMGWEIRGGHRYYYRKVRRGGRVVSEYVGGELFGNLINANIATGRRASQKVKRTQAEARAEFAELDSFIKTNEREIRALLAATLIVSGYHSHKGQWRKKRQLSR